MEDSFAEAVRYGHKCERWRGVGQAMIQDCLIAAVQNSRVLITHDYKPKKAGSGLMRGVTPWLLKSGRDKGLLGMVLFFY
jgi:hypothetical protein